MSLSSFTGLRVIFSAILLCGGLSATALAQSAGSTAASVTGIVSDEANAVIGGASVSAKNMQTNYTRDVLTGEDGAYLINQLPPGTYELIVKVEGFTTRSSRVDLVLGTTTLLNFTMQVGAATDVIEVRANNVLSEGRTESSTNLDRQRIDNLPINRRNFLDFSLTSARVVTDRVPAFGASATSGLSFNGQSARFNNITIDGLDNNDLGSGSVRSTFSQDAVQEFQVVSDNYSAEFGKAASGLVNIVTRGGGNEFNGNVFFFLRNDEISARDVFAPFEPNYKQYQFGSVLSGPIKKDRAFFFTSFERLSIKQNSFVTISDATIQAANRVGYQLSNGPAPFSVGNTAALGRFDGRINANDTFWVRVNYAGTYNGAFEPFGGLIEQGNGGIQELNDTTLAASNTYISTGLNLVNETRIQYGRRNQDVVQIDDLPQVRFRVPEGEVRFGRGTFLPMPRFVRAYQLVDTISLTRGMHNIKFGGDLLYYDTPDKKTAVPIFPGGFAFFDTLNFAQIGGIPGLPTFTPLQAFDPATRTPAQQAFLQTLGPFLPTLFPGFPTNVDLTTRSLPLVFTQGFGDPSLSAPVKFFSAFFQDDIKLRPNLLIKAGVRYDIGRVDFTPKNNGNFSPRIAISYKPIENLNIKANYGLFFNGSQLIGATFVSRITSSGQVVVPLIPFPFSVLAYSQPGRRFPNPEQGVPSNVNVIPQLTQVSVYDPNLRNSYTQQAGLGISYYIGNNTAVEVDYQYVRGVKLLSARNINPVVRPFSNNPIDNAVFGRVDPTKGDLFEFESAFDSYYHAVTFLINRRFTNRFGLLAHYTISKSIDDFVDFRFDIQEVIDPLNIRQERALSLQDVRNRFVASGVWDLSYTKNPLLKDFQLSAIINAESGRPYNLLAGVDLNKNLDNPQGDRPIVNGASIGRNLGVLPGFATVDLRLSRIVKIKEGFAVQGIFEVFNLFNRVNINDIDRIFPPDSTGAFNLPERNGSRFPAPKDRFRSAFGARQFQIGFRVTF